MTPKSLTNLVPSYECGFIRDYEDALLLVQAVVNGQLPEASRRPKDGEHSHLIKSGNVFIFEGNSSSIQRWTDGISWSPSRIMGKFLIYREKARSSSRRVLLNRIAREGDSKNGGVSKTPGSVMGNPNRLNVTPLNFQEKRVTETCSANKATDALDLQSKYYLYGALTDPIEYNKNGLMKKTITIDYLDFSYRVIAYYLPKDVEQGRLITPKLDPGLTNVVIDPQMKRSCRAVRQDSPQTPKTASQKDDSPIYSMGNLFSASTKQRDSFIYTIENSSPTNYLFKATQDHHHPVSASSMPHPAHFNDQVIWPYYAQACDYTYSESDAASEPLENESSDQLQPHFAADPVTGGIRESASYDNGPCNSAPCEALLSDSVSCETESCDAIRRGADSCEKTECGLLDMNGCFSTGIFDRLYGSPLGFPGGPSYNDNGPIGAM